MEAMYFDFELFNFDKKGRAVHSRALVLALEKFQDIFKKYSGYQNGVISGYGVRRWCKILQPGCPRLTSFLIFSSILIAEVRRGHPGCKILHHRLTP